MPKRKQSAGAQGNSKSKAVKPEAQKAAKPEYVEKIANWILVLHRLMLLLNLDRFRILILRIMDTVVPAGGPDRYLATKYNTEVRCLR